MTARRYLPLRNLPKKICWFSGVRIANDCHGGQCAESERRCAEQNSGGQKQCTRLDHEFVLCHVLERYADTGNGDPMSSDKQKNECSNSQPYSQEQLALDVGMQLLATRKATDDKARTLS